MSRVGRRADVHRIGCPACGRRVAYGPEHAGRTARCRGCDHKHVLPPIPQATIPARVPVPVPAPIAPEPEPIAAPLTFVPEPAPAPEKCHYCGKRRCTHTRDVTLIRERVQPPAPPEVEARDVPVPRCATCQRQHDLPAVVGVIVCILAVVVTAALGLSGQLSGLLGFATEAAQTTIEVGDTKVGYSVVYKVMVFLIVLLFPAVILTGAAVLAASGVQHCLLRQYGIKKESDTDSYPAIRELLADGWKPGVKPAAGGTTAAVGGFEIE